MSNTKTKINGKVESLSIKHPEGTSAEAVDCFGMITVIVESEKPEPQKTFKYEKVTESIFDLKDEFEKGLLYSSFAGHSGADNQELISNEGNLNDEFINGNVYRKVEIDPVVELAEALHRSDTMGCENYNLLHQNQKEAYKRMALCAIEKLGVK